MRAKEFLKEYKEDLPDAELRQQVVGMVQHANRELLDRVYQTLSHDEFGARMTSAMSADPDATMIQDKLAQIINTTNGTYAEKSAFLDQFHQGFIDVNSLLSKQSSMAHWFKGNRFAQAVFLSTCRNITAQGVGPGEYALAAFSPDIKFAGRSAGGGDLLVVGKHVVELKGKINKWGRLQNPREAEYDMGAIKQALDKVGITYTAKSFTAKMWLEQRGQLDPKVVPTLSKIFVDALFKHVPDADKAPLINALTKGSMTDIKSNWAVLNFVNYKAYARFDGILLFDTNSGETRYIVDAREMASLSQINAPQILGSVDQAMPQIGF